MNLYQPIRFKRTKDSEWERGIKQICEEGIKILDYSTNIVKNPAKVQADWFQK